VLGFWAQITQELQQGRNKASHCNLERERLRAIIMQERQRRATTILILTPSPSF